MLQADDFKAAMNAAGEYVSGAAQSAKEAVVGKVRLITGTARHAEIAVGPQRLVTLLANPASHLQAVTRQSRERRRSSAAARAPERVQSHALTSCSCCMRSRTV